MNGFSCHPLSNGSILINIVLLVLFISEGGTCTAGLTVQLGSLSETYKAKGRTGSVTVR